MKAIIENTTNKVLFAFEDSIDVELSSKGLVRPFYYPDIALEDYSLVNTTACPYTFTPNTYGYSQDTSWFVIDNARHLANIASSIDEEKKVLLSKINTWRQEVNYTVFSFRGKEISCDALSRSDIDGVNGYVALFQAFPSTNWYGKWKAVDNSFIDILTVNDWKELYKAMVDAGMNTFLRSQMLKSYVTSCTTLEQLQVVTWDFNP